MIHQLIAMALRQRFVVLAVSAVAIVGGIWAFRARPVRRDWRWAGRTVLRPAFLFQHHLAANAAAIMKDVHA